MKTRLSRLSRGMILTAALAFCAQQIRSMPLQLVSVPGDAIPPSVTGAGDSRSAVVSPDGRFVLFMSWADNLVLTGRAAVLPATLPPPANVFLRDRTNGTTTLVSVNLAGTGGGNGTSFPVGISSDGRYALFESTASDLVAGDTNQAGDVFVRDLVAATTMLVSTTGSGSGNGASRDPVMTPDGRYVAFVSAATNLVAGDTNRISDVFVRDLQGGTTTRASVGAVARGTNYSSVSSESPVLTPDGRYVGFSSTATGLVAGVTGSNDIYVRDLVAGTTFWASTNTRSLISTSGTPVIYCNNNRISDDGQFVTFEAATSQLSFATSPVPGFVFRHNLLTGQTDVIHTNAYFSDGGLDMTPDGRSVTFLANADGTNVCVFLWDAQAGTNVSVSGNISNEVTPGSIADSPALDAGGTRVVFVSNDPYQTTNLLTGRWHVYVRDVPAATTQLIDVDTNGVGAGVSVAAVPAMSSDGRVVAFESASPRLVTNDLNHRDDIFVRDLTAGTTELVSVRDPALPAQTPFGFSGIFSFSVSTFGRFVAFASDADNVVPNDTNGQRDVFLRDLLAGTNAPISVDTNGVFSGTNVSSEPSVSGDGRYVAFTSWASNLVAGDTNNASDVFVRDLLAGATLLVSTARIGTNGYAGNGASYSPTLSADGRFVLFLSKASNLITNGSRPLSTEHLYLRDMVLQTNYALTTIGVYVYGWEMTPDGRFVMVVTSQSASIIVFDTQLAARIYTNSGSYTLPWTAISPNGQRIAFMVNSTTLNVVDLASNTNWLVTTGTLKNRAKPRFSADGRYVAYVKNAGGAPGTQLIAVYDTQTGTNVIVTRAFDTGGTPDGSSYSPVISADGRYVAYVSDATNLVPGDLNDAQDVFVYDRVADATMMLSVNQSNNAPASQRSWSPVFSGDGRTLVFASWAGDLAGSDFNQSSDLFAYRLPPPAIADSDGDGMDDSWELAYWQTLERDGAGDFDGDGASDLFEFQTGTDPKSPASLFKGQLVLAGKPGQGLVLNWPVLPGRAYGVQYKDDLEDPNWQDWQDNLTQGSLQITNAMVDHRFYRIYLSTNSP